MVHQPVVSVVVGNSGLDRRQLSGPFLYGETARLASTLGSSRRFAAASA
jgi:hypothetical protein